MAIRRDISLFYSLILQSRARVRYRVTIFNRNAYILPKWAKDKRKSVFDSNSRIIILVRSDSFRWETPWNFDKETGANHKTYRFSLVNKGKRHCRCVFLRKVRKDARVYESVYFRVQMERLLGELYTFITFFLKVSRSWHVSFGNSSMSHIRTFFFLCLLVQGFSLDISCARLVCVPSVSRTLDENDCW